MHCGDIFCDVVAKLKKKKSKIKENQLYLFNSINIEIVLQPKFILQDSFKDNTGKKYRGINYISDFALKDKRTGLFHRVFDVKGAKTKDFIIKEKMFKEKYPYCELKLMTKSPKYMIDNFGEWCELDDLKAARKERKKLIK